VKISSRYVVEALCGYSEDTSLAVGEIAAAKPKTGDAETNGKFHKESFGNRSQKPVYYRRSEWLPSVFLI
jgi:hypothetical protein